MLHEGLVLLFRNRPALAPELLQRSLGVVLPEYSEARVESAELTQVVPTPYRADLVVLLSAGTPIFAIVVEVQLLPDEDKRTTWPVYLSCLRERMDCPTALLVVTPHEATAAWAAQPIELGHPGFILRPLVMGPDMVPVVRDEVAARQDPELTVLSAMAHGFEPVGLDIARAALGALGQLDDERARLYVDLVWSRLNDAAKAALEALMQGNYEYQSDFARKYHGQGLQEGREEGGEEGKQEGRQEEARQALLDVLGARGWSPSPELLGRIGACADLAQLKAWLRLAVSAPALEEVFSGPKL